nr:myb/SANT-like DNA-binding domain-containing protein 3 [Rhipicephalus microplus]
MPNLFHMFGFQLAPSQLKKCWNNLKQKWKEETAREKRERHKTGGESAPSAMVLNYELVGSMAAHMVTRVENAFDSDAAGHQPRVASLPVVRLLQP